MGERDGGGGVQARPRKECQSWLPWLTTEEANQMLALKRGQ